LFGIGLQEIFIVLVVALLVVGPKRLPAFARGLGRALTQVSRLSHQFYRALTEAAEEEGDETLRDVICDAARPGASFKRTAEKKEE